MKKCFLLTRPDHDLITKYLFYWSRLVIKEAKNVGFKVLDIRGKKATRKNFLTYLKKYQPQLILFNGHGADDLVTGYENEILVEAGKNEEVLSGTIVYSRSCESAKALGPAAVKKGTTAFLGYKKDYFLCYSQLSVRQPLKDKVASLFLGPSNLIPTCLLKGKLVKESFAESQRKMKRNLLFMISDKSSLAQKDAAPYLFANIKNQVALGDKQARAVVV